MDFFTKSGQDVKSVEIGSDMYDTILMAGDVHGLSDFARDTLSAIVGGAVLMGLGGIGAFIRSLRNRLDRIAVEIRYTQRSTDPPIRPFYEGDL